MAISFTLNGERVTTDVSPETMLIWVLRDHFRLTGTKFGCGIGRCGACTVHVDGAVRRSCRTRLSAVSERSVTTIEGIAATPAANLPKIWTEEKVPQCGYCQSGQIMQAAALLADNPTPTREEIVDHMDRVLCRCGTYQRILKAIERASEEG